MNLKVKIGKMTLKNPVTVASGTFGYGDEFKGFCNLKKMGAFVTKTITREEWKGNVPPRISETPSGMLNAIGLENPGIDGFLKNKSAFLKKLGIPVIVSIGGKAVDEFAFLAKKLDKVSWVDAVEIKISCQNVGDWKERTLFAQYPADAAAVRRAIEEHIS